MTSFRIYVLVERTTEMDNPFKSPNNATGPSPLDAANRRSEPDHLRFFAWYFGAFILAATLWHLSAYVRWLDILELPLSALFFPLAGFVDPHDGMVNDRSTFFYAIAFWGAVAPLALRLTPKRPLLTAFAIIVTCSSVSIAYVLLRSLSIGPVF